jgi:hypothetical protein
MMKLIDRQGEVLEQIEHLGGWELDYRIGVFHGCPALPGRRPPHQNLLRW